MKLIKIKKNKIINLYLSNSYKKIKNFFLKKKILIILDYNLYILIKKNFNIFLKKYYFLIIPYGEDVKNLNSLKIIWKYMIKNKINKNFIIIILGGGVLGDLVSFACSTYFRGIPFCILPSSLLSQIDSSIGGKNAINFFSKNTIGNINSPNFIYINYYIIFYMKKNDFKDGYSEIIKYSLLNNKKFFYYIYINKKIKKIINKSCYIKSKIISQDYYEINYRSILNLGHTYAHCIENNKITKFTHGESVTIGIIFSLFISSFFYKIKNIQIYKILNIFIKNTFCLKNYFFFSKKMLNKIILDKKFNKKINYILIKKIGFCIKKTIKKKILIYFLKKFYEI